MNETIRSKLVNGLPVVGSWLQIPDLTVTRVMADAGYDWLAVDMEHGAFDSEKLPQVLRIIAENGTSAFVRVAQASSKEIRLALDAGAQGIILPMITSGEQLSKSMNAIFYPPKGERGVGYCNANFFGKRFEAYMKTANDIFVVAQIESVQAIQNLSSIFSTESLDAIMIGPYDLSGSLGRPGDFENDAYEKALADIQAASRQHGIPTGLHVVQPDPEQLQKTIDDGHQFIAYGIDVVFLYRAADRPSATKKIG